MRRNLGSTATAAAVPCSRVQQHTTTLLVSMRVAIIAFGTRGDVQPLIVLAGGIASRSPWCSEVVLVSHRQHGDLAKPLLSACAHGSTASFATFAPVDSPAVVWKGRSVPPTSEVVLSAFHLNAKNHSLKVVYPFTVVVVI